MPSLVATTSTPARKPFVRTHYVRTNNAKLSGHYIRPHHTHNVCAHALRSHQHSHLLINVFWLLDAVKVCKKGIQI